MINYDSPDETIVGKPSLVIKSLRDRTHVLLFPHLRQRRALLLVLGVDIGAALDEKLRDLKQCCQKFLTNARTPYMSLTKQVR